jgi:hypothetical protein
MLACLFSPGPGLAQPSAPPVPNARRAPIVPVPVKIDRYSQRLVQKYDASGDGKLDPTEWGQMQGNPRLADLDRDGFLTAGELADRIARYGRRRKIRLMPSISGGKILLPSLLNPSIGPQAAEPPEPGSGAESPSKKIPSVPDSKAGRGTRRDTKFFVPRTRLPRGLPPWFVLRDSDGDAQLTMAEFAPKATQSLLDEFARYDRNGDGLVTAQECAQGPKLTREKIAGKEKSEETGAEDAFDETVEETAEAALDEGAADTGTQAPQSGAAKAAAPKRSRKSRSKKLLKPSSKSSARESP